MSELGSGRPGPGAGPATSLLVAIGNVLIVAASALLANLRQEATPGWLWALSFLWLVSMGPAIMPLITLVFAARDISNGRRTQAWWAIGIAVLTGAVLWGRVEVGF